MKAMLDGWRGGVKDFFYCTCVGGGGGGGEEEEGEAHGMGILHI